MSDNRIKVVGYAQRVFFNDGIEYRNFSDDLVGAQLASNGGTSLFTIGNFSITTNLDDKISKLFYTSNFSDYIDLQHLNLTNEDVLNLLKESNKIKLNLDRSKITNHALFGSFTEFIRVSLENIILNWPASISTTPIDETSVVGIFPTVENYVYDNITDSSTFRVSTNRFLNNYGINYLKNGEIINSFTNVNDLRNLTINYTDYVISNNNGEFSVLNFTGATNASNDYVYFQVSGDAFKDYVSFQTIYHIKPNSVKVEKFFKSLNDFESYILNRFTTPIYTSTYSYDLLTETGGIIISEKSVTWPVNDGYNLDFESESYIKFVSDLLEIAENSDLTKTNLVNRFFVSESITDFDTLPSLENDDFTSGQKMNSLLKIYGREFDEIKKYIDGIAFANVVSYDKKNNIPDALVKNLARVLGWDVTSSILEIDLINNYLTINNSSYSGHSVSLSPIEAEVELWRRLVLNSPWLWKSKGTRKAIEFLFKFIGTPNGLISFNEFIYVADNSMDMKFFNSVLEEITESTSIEDINIDSEGYPKILPDTTDMYFQKAGLWYRETGGPNSKEDVLQGNNPHIGPYDGGQEYMNQFRGLIPDFEPVTLVSENKFNIDNNIFTNYDEGTFNDVFNNDVVATFNLEEWYNNLNNSIYASIVEDLSSYQVQPYIDTCSGTTDITMNSYLDNVLVYSETLSGVTYSGGMIIDSATMISGFSMFLDSTIINLNTANTTTLTNSYNGIIYDIIDDIELCGDNTSFYSDKSLEVRFDINFGYSCDGGDCDPKSLDVNHVDDETGFVYFDNVMNNIVPSAECCTNLGYTATAVTGGYNCYSPVKTPPTCADYTPAKADNDGYMIFFGPEGATYYVPSAQCCPIGTTAISNVDGTLFKCLTNETPCDEYIPKGVRKEDILFSTPSGDTYVIPYSACCPSYTTPEVNGDGYNCRINCEPYVSYSADMETNLITFTGPTGNTFTDFLTYSCCPSGSEVLIILLDDGSTVYNCYTGVTSSSPFVGVVDVEDGGNSGCKETTIQIIGASNTTIYYEANIINNGNHGYTSTMVGDDNVFYPTMNNNTLYPIVIGNSGEVVLLWKLCARPSIRAGEQNCVEVGLTFYHNNTELITITAFDCNN